MSPVHVHEAGHAVTAIVLGVPWLRATVGANGRGQLVFDGDPATWRCEISHRRAAVVSLAGAWAEALYTRARVPFSRSDRDMAESYLERGPESFAELSQIARELVARHWSAVLAVASLLARAGVILPEETRLCLKH